MSVQVQTREIHYQTQDGKQFIGYFAYPEGQENLAGVLVAPEWWGRNAYTEQRAQELAEAGYAALAIDMYGDNQSTADSAQAYEWMMSTFAHADTIVNRAQAAFDTLSQQPEVNAEKIAAIGFCYGGKVILDLARSGSALNAAITFHANLSANIPAQKDHVNAEVLVLHGELDSMVSLDDVENFKHEMQNADVKHEVMILKDAKHGFSNPLADERAKANNIDLGYNAEAEKTALTAMYALLARTLN